MSAREMEREKYKSEKVTKYYCLLGCKSKGFFFVNPNRHLLSLKMIVSQISMQYIHD